MSKKHKQPIDMFSLLNSSSGTLAQISAKTNFLTKLSDIVRQNCPDLPADAWHIANFRENIIVIEVKTAIWGQRLQFERMKLASAIAQASEQVFTQIEIKVNPRYAAKKTPANKPTLPKRQHTISATTAAHLTQAAEHAPDSLKAKLLRLAALSKLNKQ
jgi:hypothetical protein